MSSPICKKTYSLKNMEYTTIRLGKIPRLILLYLLYSGFNNFYILLTLIALKREIIVHLSLSSWIFFIFVEYSQYISNVPGISRVEITGIWYLVGDNIYQLKDFSFLQSISVKRKRRKRPLQCMYISRVRVCFNIVKMNNFQRAFIRTKR